MVRGQSPLGTPIMQQRRVVSKRVFIKPEKVGEVRLAPLPPQSPVLVVPSPVIIDDEPRRQSASESIDILPLMGIAGMVVAGIAIFVWVLMQPKAPRVAVLENVSWTFEGRVEERRLVVEETFGPVPREAMRIINTTTNKVRQWRTVVDRVDRVCTIHNESRRVVTHHVPVCTLERTGWTPAVEVYSHSEEVCYDDGVCEESDVYVEQPAQPILTEVCHSEPVYGLIWEPQERCRNEEVTHQEPVYGTATQYEIERWVPTRTVHAAEAALAANERYSETQWNYYLHFASPVGRVSVNETIYRAYRAQLGQAVLVP